MSRELNELENRAIALENAANIYQDNADEAKTAAEEAWEKFYNLQAEEEDNA